MAILALVGAFVRARATAEAKREAWRVPQCLWVLRMPPEVQAIPLGVAGLLSRGKTAALEAYSTLMKPVKVAGGAIHEANRACDQRTRRCHPGRLREIDRGDGR